MADALLTLTPQLVKELCERIKAGAYEHVAAESLGVPAARYRRWLARGRARGSPPLYRALWRGVLEARAHARMMAEMDMRKGNPKTWLLHGPGRETAARPGWSAAPRPAADDAGPEANALLHPDMVQLLHTIAEALRGFPEAQAVVHALLDRVRRPRPEKS